MPVSAIFCPVRFITGIAGSVHPLSQVVNGSALFQHLPTDHTTGGSPPPPFPLPSPPTRHYSTVACLLDDSILFTPFSAWALNFMKMT